MQQNKLGCRLLVVLSVCVLVAASATGCGAKKDDDGKAGGKEKEAATGLDWPTPYFDNQRTGRSPYSGPGTNEVAWTYQSGAVPSRSSWVVLGKDGNPFAGFSGKAASLGAADGVAEWEYPLPGAEATTGRTGEDGTIYVSAGSRVYALSGGGTEKWSYEVGGKADDPAVADDGTVYVGSTAGKLVALSKDGSLDWEFQAMGDIRSPSIGKDGTLYCSGATLVLYCFDSEGNGLWEFKPEGDLPRYDGLFEWANTLDVPSIGDDGTIYAGSFVNPGMAQGGQQIPGYAVPQQGKIYAVSPAGEKKWEYAHPGSTYTIHTPTIGRDGTLYAGTSCWKVIALDPGGTLLWEFDTDEGTNECPSVYSPSIGKDGLLYAATTNSRIFCITPEGTEVWRFDADNPWLPGPQGEPMMGGSNNFTPPAIGADGTLYSLLAEGKVFAFRAAAASE